jgi:Na+/H+ antiporter NhaD/arsenite permease-like protein
VTQAQLSLIIFTLTYIGFFTLTKWRGFIAVGGMSAILLGGVIPFGEAVQQIPWTVLMIFVGVLIIAEALMVSRLPNVAAEKIVSISPTAGMALLYLCLASSFLSIFIENIACVLIMAPLGIAISRKLGISPIAPIIGIAISSNLQGCGTLIGDPPSMLLAAHLKLSFNDFFWYNGRPGIFWAVQVGAIASMFVLYVIFKPYNAPSEATDVEDVESYIPLALLIILIAGLFTLSLIKGELKPSSGYFCLGVAALSGLWIYRFSSEEFRHMIKRLDYQTFFFLLGSFVVVHAIDHHGWLERFANFIVTNAGTEISTLFILLILISVVFSAVVANEPYLIAMLPVTGKLAAATVLAPDAHPLFYFGLLLGASLGGNITPIGAAACVVAFGILRKNNEPVGFLDFFKIGIPFTIAAVGAGSVFLWLFWAP